MSKFVLPPGYSFEPPPEITAQDTVPGKGYGGADVSQEWDYNGVHYVGCNATGPGDPPFRWRMFKEVSPGRYEEVPLPFLSTGRGEQLVQLYDGQDWAIAWEGNTFNYGVVPGFARFPSMRELVERIQALENIIINLEPDTPLPKPPKQPIPITKDSPLGKLYVPPPGVEIPYAAKDFDTDEEDAVRVGKQLMAIHQLVAILERQGLVVKL